MKEKKRHRYYHVDPEVGLPAAILRVAAVDYENALRKQMEDRECLKTNREVKRLENFFLSNWGQLLSDYHGELIIEKCRRNVHEGGVAI